MTVHTAVHGPVLVVRLDREHKRNAIDAETAAGISAALDRLDDDPDLWCGVLTGTATVFSAGTDLTSAQMPRTDRGGEYGIIRRRRTTPLIAAVEGPVLGGGFEIALACDMIVAGDTARFGLPESQRGLVPTCGALFRTARALPAPLSRAMLLAGRTIDADQALAHGLVTDVVPAGTALAAARELADQVCRSSPAANRLIMAALTEIDAAGEAAGWAATDAAAAAMLATDDMAEGVRAFFGRREPRWTGR